MKDFKGILIDCAAFWFTVIALCGAIIAAYLTF